MVQAVVFIYPVALRFRGVEEEFHSKVPMVSLLELVQLWIPCTGLVLVELRAEIKVASRIVPWFMAMPSCLK